MEDMITCVSQIIRAVTEAIFYFRRQNHTRGYRCSKQALALGEAYFEKAVQVGFQESVELLLPIWKSLLEATEAGDEVQLADIYEHQLLNALYEIQSCLLENFSGEPITFWDDNMALLEKKDAGLYRTLKEAEESTEREYAFSWALTGDPVLKVNTAQGTVQLNTAVNPWQEALSFSEANLAQEQTKYSVIGFGLGYHVEMLEQQISCQELTVIEHDLEQLRIAFMYRDLSAVLNSEKVRIVYAKKAADYGKWLNPTEQKTVCILWYPSVKTIVEEKLKEAMENYWISGNSAKMLGPGLEANFEKNIRKQDDNVDVLRADFCRKKMILVAAGPSLDDNLDSLKKAQGKEDIRMVCVGKVAAKLIKYGIRPDYLVMIDAMHGTNWQIRGIEEAGIPLIYLSTAASTVVEAYKGKRYIAFQEGFEPAKEEAERRGVSLYQAGGSVATFALDLGLCFGCERIICVGLDLGYPNSHSHAEGVGHAIADTKSLRQVEGVDGGRIYTNRTLDMYRIWIERRIRDVKGTVLINASSGVRIHGMQEKSLEESL